MDGRIWGHRGDKSGLEIICRESKIRWQSCLTFMFFVYIYITCIYLYIHIWFLYISSEWLLMFFMYLIFYMFLPSGWLTSSGKALKEVNCYFLIGHWILPCNTLHQGDTGEYWEWPWFQSLACDAGRAVGTCTSRRSSHETDPWMKMVGDVCLISTRRPLNRKDIMIHIDSWYCLELKTSGISIEPRIVFSTQTQRVLWVKFQSSCRIRSIGALRSIVLAIVSTLWSLVWTLVFRRQCLGCLTQTIASHGVAWDVEIDGV